jgi:Spy/CpxP family protein refolding chaperone
MKVINKNNWMVWAIAVLAVMNLTTLITVIYHRNKVVEQVAVITPYQSKSEYTSINYSGRYFRDELNLSNEQMNSFSEFNTAFRQKVMAINRNLYIKREEMLAEMAKQICDTNRLNLLSDSIGYLHASLKKQTYLYYMNFKNICTEQQQEKLKQLFGEMFSSDFQRRQQGRGGPGGRRFGRYTDN